MGRRQLTYLENLTPKEWLEGAASFIKDARRTIKRAKNCGVFGRGYLIEKAEEKLVLADGCIVNAEIAMPPSSIETELRSLAE
jgi:hypothetical protein